MSIWNILLYALHVFKRACAYGCGLKSQNLLIKKNKDQLANLYRCMLHAALLRSL